MIKQWETPPEFPNRWRVCGMPGEDEHAGRICKVTGWADHRLCTVQFLDADDGSTPETANLTPHMLFPVLP